MARKLQLTLEHTGIEWPALRKHIPCMVHVIQLGLGAFRRSLGVKARTRSWKAHERDQQFGEDESMGNRKNHRHQLEGNARINTVSAVSSGLAKIIWKVHTSRYFGSPETHLHIAKNASCIDYANPWLYI
jgi:hypothetical protein